MGIWMAGESLSPAMDMVAMWKELSWNPNMHNGKHQKDSYFISSERMQQELHRDKVQRYRA